MKIRVVAAIIKKNNRILIAQRKEDCSREPNKWEFPGGKIELGETPEHALVREIGEELGVNITVGDLFGESVKKYQNKKEIILSCYFAKLKKGTTPQKLGVKDWKWIKIDEMYGYDFADADILIIQLLSLKTKKY